MTIGSVYGAYGGVTFPKAVDFDGATYLARGSDLTTNPNLNTGIAYGILRRSRTASIETLFTNKSSSSTSGLKIEVDAADKLHIQMRSDGSNFTDIESTVSLTSTTTFYRFLCSWDATTRTGYIVIDDVAGVSVSNTGSTSNFGASGDFAIGATTNGADLFDGCLAEMWLLPSAPTLVNITTPTERRKFMTADLKAVYLGENGEIPYGQNPAIYLSGDYRTWQNNLGDGGGFTENGTLKICNTRPR